MRRVIALACLALAAVGCGRPTPGPAAAGVRLSGGGATFPYPLYSRWLSEYQKVAPGVRIEYQSIGSGGGIQQLKAGTVDFGASDTPLDDREAKAMPRPVIHLPGAAGAVAIIYHLPSVTGELRLTGEALAAIYLGQLKRWNAPELVRLNPGVTLPDLPIAVAHRSDGSGTTAIFSRFLAAMSKDWAARVGTGKSLDWPVGIGAKGNEGVSGLVKQTPGAIGYVELTYAIQNRLPTAAVRNAAGRFVAPDIRSISAAASAGAEAMVEDIRASIVNSPAPEAYPICGFTYLLVYQQQTDPAKGEALVRFLRWAIHEGQQFAEPLHYAPLPPEVVALNDAALATINIPRTDR